MCRLKVDFANMKCFDDLSSFRQLEIELPLLTCASTPAKAINPAKHFKSARAFK
jgi:hypothetical protein